jgi:small subunit ribosomal protein S16
MKKRPFYRVVVAHSDAPRDGRFIEQVGYYDPMTEPSTIKIDEEKTLKWLGNGAQPTDSVASLLRRTGIQEKFDTAKAAAKAEVKAAKAAAGS